jgi:uncharacterized protein (TIGR02300 family)
MARGIGTGTAHSSSIGELSFDSRDASWQTRLPLSGAFVTRLESPAGPDRTREIVALAKAELGTKRLCQSCGAKFYDLNRSPIVCPKCETVLDLESAQKKRSRPSKAVKPEPEEEKAKKAKPAEAAESETAVDDEENLSIDEGDEDGDDYIEDTSELDDDDMSDVSIDSDDDDT